MKLTEKYADKSPEELPPLFQRILQNTIRDFFRRQKSRSIWITLFSAFSPNNHDEKENDDYDLLEVLPISKDSGFWGNDPHRELEQSQLINLVEKALETLPARQREAFLLRYWEEMDVSETAKVMGCSEGSVKTHCSRAAHTLATLLKEKGVKL
ncbi:RNA polymerase sigma-70 factor, ECF subfamily [Nitrosomonas sp. Nm33]|nr:RNA polymerase sigma-70 factor, ECF subfamily [Nitrosomonas sp. Nm33]